MLTVAQLIVTFTVFPGKLIPEKLSPIPILSHFNSIHLKTSKLRDFQSAKGTIPTERPPLVGEI
jgi:hypothetical protein